MGPFSKTKLERYFYKEEVFRSFIELRKWLYNRNNSFNLYSRVNDVIKMLASCKKDAEKSSISQFVGKNKQTTNKQTKQKKL